MLNNTSPVGVGRSRIQLLTCPARRSTLEVAYEAEVLVRLRFSFAPLVARGYVTLHLRMLQRQLPAGGGKGGKSPGSQPVWLSSGDRMCP